MLDSHESLRQYYECSHPRLDTLVELSRNFAFGARLTGAGWGGCVVALVLSSNVEHYINYLKDNYYTKFGLQERINDFVFCTSPNAGACIYKYDVNA